MTDRLLTADEVAELLSVPVTWVREHTRTGAIPHVRLGRYLRYREADVFAWVGRCSRGGRPVRLRGYDPGNSPRTAVTAGARHRRSDLRCRGTLTAAAQELSSTTASAARSSGSSGATPTVVR